MSYQKLDVDEEVEVEVEAPQEKQYSPPPLPPQQYVPQQGPTPTYGTSGYQAPSEAQDYSQQSYQQASYQQASYQQPAGYDSYQNPASTSLPHHEQHHQEYPTVLFNTTC